MCLEKRVIFGRLVEVDLRLGAGLDDQRARGIRAYAIAIPNIRHEVRGEGEVGLLSSCAVIEGYEFCF